MLAIYICALLFTIFVRYCFSFIYTHPLELFWTGHLLSNVFHTQYLYGGYKSPIGSAILHLSSQVFSGLCFERP